MQKRLAVASVLGALLVVTTGGARPARAEPPTAGDERILTLKSALFENTRSLRVLLPPGYDDAANRERRYPVFYFTDGRAAWDAWGLPRVARDLWRSGAIPAVIFVAIDNGGSTVESKEPGRDRASEYLPYPDPSWEGDPPPPRGDRFPAFLFGEVVPLIDREFRTQPDGASTGLAGDSYAGAAALHTAITHASRIGWLLLESPSLHVGDGRLLDDARAARAWPGAVYLGVGTAEGATPEIQASMVATVRQLHATLEGASPAPRLLLLVKEGAGHWYDAWNERLPAALTFLFGGTTTP